MRLNKRTVFYYTAFTVMACMVYFPLSFLFIEGAKLLFGQDILDYMFATMFRFAIANIIYYTVLLIVGGSIVGWVNKKFLIKAFKFNEINVVRR